MYNGNRIAVVVPAYNEEGFVGRTIETTPSFVDRVYAVDDGSTDGTWDEIRRTARRLNADKEKAMVADGGHRDGEFVVPLRHETNRGVGASVKTGYRAAMEDEMDVVAVMNGDAQMDPSILHRFLDPIVEGRADYAKGDRISRRENVGEMSRWRLFGNHLLTSLTNLSSGYWRTVDSQNGYTAISVDALREIPLEDVYDEYGFLNDLLTTLNLHDFRVVNVPHRAVYGDEESGIVYREFVPRLSGLLLRNFLRRLAARSRDARYVPAVLAYCLGVVATCFGAGSVLRAAERGVRRRDSSGLLRGVVTGVCGAVLFVLGCRLDARAAEPLETEYAGERFEARDDFDSE
ncbi:glycosyltransferase family 2 protein [Halopelagius longus]|uniref:Glycosyltransferase family 2 protein n=1 Tax=Halopelagius longus TaxID=1236180 RepID=A0A1H1GND3_9EURY|nr:glycosyltransferase family 2 protein [Halopelagius longus]RDI69637.1 glycosyltransferase family 2 protein [Halopelagius longus]SDR14734.1 Glycosyltransferase involved in cell wall bisynthesis [Halopelagius longus]